MIDSIPDVSNMSLEDLIEGLHRDVHKREPFRGSLLALDPGETTGYAIFRCRKGVELLEHGEIATKTPRSWSRFETLIGSVHIDRVAYEAYHVYSWKLKQHSFSAVHTAQVIGVIRYLCHTFQKPVTAQTAQVAKTFATDDKLQNWGYWVETAGQRHARDAVRHGCYWLLFNSNHPGDEK